MTLSLFRSPIQSGFLLAGFALLSLPGLPAGAAPVGHSTPAFLNVKDFGAKGDGVTDDYHAFTRAIESAPLGSGNRIDVPAGTYFLSRTLHINRQIILEGAGGSGWYAPTILLFPDGVTGIIVDRPTTSRDGGRGDWSRISDLAIRAKGKTIPGADGIWLRARANVSDFYVQGFSRDGIRIVADSNSHPSTNANGWKLDTGKIDGCGGNGVYVQGGDTNAGICIGVDASENGGWGFWDSSFLGNTYMGTESADNGKGAYQSDGVNARNLFLGVYAENGQPPSHIVFPATIIGGLPGKLTPDSNPQLLGDGRIMHSTPAQRE